jgi:hypothetical protein
MRGVVPAMSPFLIFYLGVCVGFYVTALLIWINLR